LTAQSHGFATLLIELLRRVGDWQPASIGVGVVALLLLFACERLRRLP